MLNYGEILKEIRTIKGKTLLEVERDTGISNANLSRWENGKVIPSIDFCIRLADYYGVTLDELFGRDERFASSLSTEYGLLQTKEEKEIIELLKRLDPSTRSAALEFLRSLTQRKG